MAKRIQRKRTKGWRMPENTVYVGRPTKWGNPFRIDDDHETFFVATRAEAVERFKRLQPGWERVVRRDLRGKDLACWCPLDQPCHADVLLEWANA